MNTRGPIELLGAIADEVEGLRKTDPSSSLPLTLLLEIRRAVDGVGNALTNSQRLSSIDDLKGRTVTHVFQSGLKTGDVLLLCDDGAFVVLAAVKDGDEASISTHTYGSQLKDFLRPLAMREAGMLSVAEYETAEKEQRTEAARSQLARAKAAALSAERELEELQMPVVIEAVSATEKVNP